MASSSDEASAAKETASIGTLEDIEPGATPENQALVLSDEVSEESKHWEENTTEYHITNSQGIKGLTRLMRSVSVKTDEEHAKLQKRKSDSDASTQIVEEDKNITESSTPAKLFIPTDTSPPDFSRQTSAGAASSDYPDTPTASINSDMSDNFYSAIESRERAESNIEGDLLSSESWLQKPRHFFVLTEAGKPVYTRHGCEDKLAPLMGVLLALVSCVYDRKDTLRFIIAGNHKFVFMPRPPLILVAICSTMESVHQVHVQLSYVYNTIISVLTLSQLTKIYETKKNFDLRRLLTGTDKFLNNLCESMDNQPQFLLQAVQCLPISGNTRDIIGQSLQLARTEDLAFAILLSNNQIVNICRLKEHSLHPADLHLIINLVSSSSTAFHTGESWTPICLPNFNPNGFLHAHISYLDDDCSICLLLLSADRDAFFTLHDSKERVMAKLRRHACLEALKEANKIDAYDVKNVGISALRHFVYKSKSTSQFTCPEIGFPYTTEEQQTRIFGLYQHTHGRIHDASCSLKLLYLVSETETILGWVTSGFELYGIFGPLVTKNNAISAVNRLLRWIKKQEDELFILRPPIF